MVAGRFPSWRSTSVPLAGIVTRGQPGRPDGCKPRAVTGRFAAAAIIAQQHCGDLSRRLAEQRVRADLRKEGRGDLADALDAMAFREATVNEATRIFTKARRRGREDLPPEQALELALERVGERDARQEALTSMVGAGLPRLSGAPARRTVKHPQRRGRGCGGRPRARRVSRGRATRAGPDDSSSDEPSPAGGHPSRHPRGSEAAVA